ncbi:MAG: hypothetical protein AAF850_02600 [Pseudomonadota bacterium]
MDGVAFLDIEASGLNEKSWPVEIGWALPDQAETSLIVKPDPAWPDAGWDPSAEELHGLHRDTLDADGLPAKVVCERLNKALRGRTVYSDAIDWDGFWLYRLFQAGRQRPAFLLESFNAIIDGLSPRRRDAVLIAHDALAPGGHRAATDAARLLGLYRIAIA